MVSEEGTKTGGGGGGTQTFALWDQAMPSPPRGSEREGQGLRLTVFTYDTGRFQGLGLACPQPCPPLQGWREVARGPHPHTHFVLSWWGAPGPLPPAAWGFTFTNLEIV
jgi:hypothetical protein